MGPALGSSSATSCTPLLLHTGVGGVRVSVTNELYQRALTLVAYFPQSPHPPIVCPEVWLLPSWCFIASSKGLLQGYLENEKKERRKSLIVCKLLAVVLDCSCCMDLFTQSPIYVGLYKSLQVQKGQCFWWAGEAANQKGSSHKET